MQKPVDDGPPLTVLTAPRGTRHRSRCFRRQWFCRLRGQAKIGQRSEWQVTRPECRSARTRRKGIWIGTRWKGLCDRLAFDFLFFPLFQFVNLIHENFRKTLRYLFRFARGLMSPNDDLLVPRKAV